MNVRKLTQTACLLVLTLTAGICSAVAPHGKFTNDLSGLQLYDLTGSYDGQTISATFGEDGQYLSSIVLNVDRLGRVTGDATFTTYEGDTDAPCVGYIRRASVKGPTMAVLVFRGVTPTTHKRESVTLTLKVVGNDDTPASATPGEWYLDGTGTVCIGGRGCQKIPDLSSPVLTGTSETWLGTISITAGAKQKGRVPLSGTSMIQLLASDFSTLYKELPFSGKGNYSLTTGYSLLTFRGSDFQTYGSAFNIQVLPRPVAAMPVLFTNMSGVLLGQRILLTNVPPFNPGG